MYLKKYAGILAIMMLISQFITGCGDSKAPNLENEVASETSSVVDVTTDMLEQSNQEKTTTQQSTTSFDKVASKDEMATPENVVDENMVPVTADMLNDGKYDISVDSSSSMFNIVACELTVENGKMSAVMTMGGTGYTHVYVGTGEDAAKADESKFIPFVENADGQHTYEIPVEALNKGIDCAAFSKKKEQWYDRTLVFKADSLPMTAFNDSTVINAESLGLEDGEYTVEVTLGGGSGRAKIESPAKLVVENSVAKATIVWGSSNYDYMVVDGEKILPLENMEKSTFEIPVAYFGREIPVLGDTTAMSTPHEIEYTLLFDEKSVQKP